MNNTVSAVIICYNSKKLLKSCLGSLKNQTFKNLEIICIDNASEDGTCAHLKDAFTGLTVVCNSQNSGYAAAANQGIRIAKGEFVMVMNPDVILEPGYVEKCVRKMLEDNKIAAITGKLYKYDFAADRKTNLIDTVGLFSFRNRRIVDEGQGLEDNGQFGVAKEVFGVSGACPVYRKSALEDTKISLGDVPDEYFDEDFFMYKEDVDLSWRLRLYGWKCFYLPDAVGYHGRGTGALKRFSHFEVLKNRSKLSKIQKYDSYKNQRLMQLKNEFIRGFLWNFFPIIWKEILIKGYIIFREPFLLKACFQLLSQIPRALRKRKLIMRHRRVNWREMEKWLSTSRK